MEEAVKHGVIVGYVLLFGYSLWVARRVKRPTRRVAVLVLSAMAVVWLVFYLLTSVGGGLTGLLTLDQAVFASRLAQIPTLAAAYTLLVLMRDAEQAEHGSTDK